SEVPALARRLAGLEPECAINLRPPIPVTCASIAIDRGQPTSVPVRAARPWRLRDPLVEACFDAAPVEERRSADVVEIRCFHDRSDATDHRMSTASEKWSASGCGFERSTCSDAERRQPMIRDC